MILLRHPAQTAPRLKSNKEFVDALQVGCAGSAEGARWSTRGALSEELTKTDRHDNEMRAIKRGGGRAGGRHCWEVELNSGQGGEAARGGTALQLPQPHGQPRGSPPKAQQHPRAPGPAPAAIPVLQPAPRPVRHRD